MTAFFSNGLRKTWACAALALLALASAHAQQAPETVAARTYDLPPVTPDEYNGDVRHLPPNYLPRRYVLLNEFESPPHHKPVSPQPAQPSEPNLALGTMPSPSANFAGLAFSTAISGGQAGGGWPPDTNGDVGPSVYIQAVNTAFGIFDKSNGAVLAAFTENQLWSAASGSNPCRTDNQGDPVVLHDALNDRWILTDFAFPVDSSFNPIGPFYECLAVSKTGDPVSGGWWFYAIRMDTGNANQPPTDALADYPKFGLWNDGCLYMGANAFDNVSGSYLGPVFASFNTANLYAGAALTSSLGFLADTSVFGMFPANLLGTSASSLPPAGRQEFFVSESQTGFSFDVRKFTKGANCGGGGSLGTATSVNQASYGYPAVKLMGKYSGNMVQQSGTTNRLDALGDRIMQKVQYRKISSAESLWVVHSTCGTAQNADGACSSSTHPAQPQWAQINVSGGTIATTPVQQQIYAPDSTTSRWMGSLAVDGSGDMALGYSTSSSTAFPGIAYAGRLKGDPSGQLPQSEAVLIAGSGSQTLKLSGAFVPRWGDYSSMSIDPADDCTFWYTTEYYDSAAHGSSGDWQTRIGAFRFPSCIGPASKLVFSQEPNSGYVSNGTITVKVSVETANGAVVTSDTSAITLALQGGNAGATLGGTKTVNAVAGIATFNLSVDLAGSGYMLHATDGSLTPADSTAFNIVHGSASKLAFTTQPPASTQAGTGFGVVVTAQDAAGNTVTSDSSAVTLSLTCGCATVGGTNIIVTIAGVATFPAVNITKAGMAYQLKATDSNAGVAAATSTAFDITVGPPASVAWTTQPATNSNVVAGTAIALVAHVQDSHGNAVAGDNVTLAIANNPGSASLSVAANPVATDSSGNATFANASLDKIGSGYTLRATEATGSHAATGNAFNIVAAAPATISLTTQPATNSDIAAGTAIPLVAHVQDGFGNAIAGDSVTLAIANNAGGGTLSVAANPVVTNGSGDASFDNVSIDKIGVGYTLAVTEAGASHNATSNAFNIVLGPVAQLLFTTQPTDVAQGGTLNTIAVTEADAGGNPITTDSTTGVDFTIAVCGGTVDLGSAAMNNGVATLSSAQVFSTLRANPPGLKVTATDATLTISGLSQAFAVGPSDLLFTDGFEACAL